MTPKEMAKELFDKYSVKVNVIFYENSIPNIINAEMTMKSAKQCALIAVNEIIKVSMDNLYSERYWQEVRKEIEAL